MVIDHYGIIVQQDFDGGDSLHREGMYAFAKKLRYDYLENKVYVDHGNHIRRPANSSEILDRFEVQPGVYVRHPDPQKWYSNPQTTSRDQLIPVIAYCAAHQDYPRLERLFKATLSRSLFAQNLFRIGDGENQVKMPDPMHLNLSLFIRAGGWSTAPLYPLLFAYDAIDLVGTILTAIPWHFKDDHFVPRVRRPDDVDDNNTVVVHLLAAHFKPTPISELNRYIYTITRPINYGNTILGEKNPVMGALVWYHRNQHGGTGNPEMAEMYRPLVEKYFDYQNPFKNFFSDFEFKKLIPF